MMMMMMMTMDCLRVHTPFKIVDSADSYQAVVIHQKLTVDMTDM